MDDIAFLESSNVFSATIQYLSIYKGFLIKFTRTLNTLCQSFDQLMAKITGVVVEYFLEFFQHFGVVGGEIKALLFGLSVGVALLPECVLEHDVVVFAE